MIGFIIAGWTICGVIGLWIIAVTIQDLRKRGGDTR
jgi:hypothetical protein